MTTLLNYLAVVHDYYLIKTRRAPQAMGHHQHGFVAHDICQQMQDLAFGGRIQTFCRFIEQHQRRIVEQRAGNGQSAQFAAGELTPAFAQPAVKTTILQQFFEAHLLKGSAEMSVIRFRRRQQQVVAQGGAEQVHALRHYAHCLPQSGFAEAGERLIVEQNLSL